MISIKSYLRALSFEHILQILIMMMHGYNEYALIYLYNIFILNNIDLSQPGFLDILLKYLLMIIMSLVIPYQDQPCSAIEKSK